MRNVLACGALLAALAGCGSEADKQLEAVKAARTVLAEWALVEEQAAKGQTPETYAEEMRDAAKSQLRTAQSALREDQPRAAQLMETIVDGEPSADELKAAGSRLEPLETRLESA